MSNILRLSNILLSSPPKTEEQQFMSTILSHLDYLFASIILGPHGCRQKVEEVKEVGRLESSQMEIEKKEKEQEMLDCHQCDSNIEPMPSPISDISSGPSIEEISNFQSSGEESEKRGKGSTNKISRLKRRQKSMYYRNNKKPISSFVFFYKDRLQQIKKCKSEEYNGNIAKLLSKEWKMLSPRQKRPYVQKAQRSLEAYYTQKKRINEHSKAIKKMGRLKKMIEDNSSAIQENNENEEPEEDSVHKVLTSFFIYFKENTQRITKESGEKQRGKLAKIASDEWKKLSLEEKKKYEELSLKSRQQNEQVRRLKGGKTKASSAKGKYRKMRTLSASQEEEYKPRIYRNTNRRSCFETTNDSQNIDKANNLNEMVPFSLNNQSGIVEKLEKGIFFEQMKEQVINEQRQRADNKNEEDLNCDLNHHTIIQLNSNEQHASKGQCNEIDSQFKLFQEKSKEGKKLKGPLSAFLLYYQLNIKELMQENINAKGSELVKLASSHWSKLTDQEKHVYQQQARMSRQKSQAQHDAHKHRERKMETRTKKTQAKK